MKKNNVKMSFNMQEWLKNASCVFKKKWKRWAVVTVVFIITIAIMTVTAMFTVSLSIKSVTKDRILDAEYAAQIEDVDYILVLGAGLRSDGSPSDMLEDRLLTGVKLIDGDFEGKLLLSGDNSGEHYNEVGAMHDYSVNAGISEDAIVDDDFGFSTYESLYRARYEYGAKKIVVVTQEYHLHRALYIAEELGLEAYGVSADVRSYRGQTYRDLREHIARFKDFFVCLTEEQ